MDIIVQTQGPEDTRATLIIGGARYDCALGRTGVALPSDKKEGDGKTPIGTYSLRQVFYRADRMPPPETALPLQVLTPSTGWCEDPAKPEYNTCIAVPPQGDLPEGVDRMTRDDHLYDITVVIGYNDDPPQAGRGSAIFMHLARPGYTPTAGCIALSESDLRQVLKQVTPQSRVTVLPPPR